jgi:hypothetical protein
MPSEGPEKIPIFVLASSVPWGARSVPPAALTRGGKRLIQRVRHPQRVAVYSLDADDFPVQPAITNYGKVRNSTDDSRM